MTANSSETTLVVGAKSYQHPTLDFLYRYWDKKRGQRALPRRSDIIASELRPHLGWVILVDVSDDLSQFRFRLVGTLVTQYFLTDGTGKTAEEVFADRDPSVAKAISGLFRKSAVEQAVLHTSGSALWLGPGFEEFEAIYLPLSDDGERVNMILHAFVFDRERVLMAREIARANGGQLLANPPKRLVV
jgi:hypothetical protein